MKNKLLMFLQEKKIHYNKTVLRRVNEVLKTYYHATPFENLGSIFRKGILKGLDGVVYLTEKPEEAIRFVAIRGHKKMLVIEVEVEDYLVNESFDHSQAFFKCKAYSYPYDISIDEFGDNVKTYEI